MILHLKLPLMMGYNLFQTQGLKVPPKLTVPIADFRVPRLAEGRIVDNQRFLIQLKMAIPAAIKGH